MDKNRQISVRINGKEKLIEGTAKKETAAAEEKKEFNWVLPHENESSGKIVDLRERKKQYSRRKKSATGAPKLPLHRRKAKHKLRLQKKKSLRMPPKKQWLSAFSAVAVGLMIGFVVLAVFTDHRVEQMTTTAGKNDMKEQATKNAANEQAPVSENLDWTLQIVQGAAFSTLENAQTAATRLKTGGYAAVLHKMENKVYLFIGVGTEEAKAKAIGELYQQNGQDFWVKAYDVNANERGMDEEARTFFGKSKALLQGLIAGSVRALTSGGPAFTDGQWAHLEKTYGQWQELAENVNAKPLKDALEAAMGNMGNYRKQPDDSLLWKTQQSLLEAVLKYQHLVE